VIRDRLNAYCKAVNEPIGETGETPASAYGKMLAVNRGLRGLELLVLKLDAAQWRPAEAEARRAVVEQLQQRLGRTGVPTQHPFWGSGLMVLLPIDADEVARSTKVAVQALDEIEATVRDLAEACGAPQPASIGEAGLLMGSATFVACAPELSELDPSDPGWSEDTAEITRVLEAGRTNRDLRKEYAGLLRPDAWDRDVAKFRREVADVGSRWWRFLSRLWRKLRDQPQRFPGKFPSHCSAHFDLPSIRVRKGATPARFRKR
jgi:hypothetical protein